MGTYGQGIVFYGVGYSCLTYQMRPRPIWDRSEADDEDEGLVPQKRPWDRENVSSWYLHTQGLLTPRPGQSREAHEKEQAAALAALGIEVGTHGAGEYNELRWYIAATGSKHVADTDDGATRLPELIKDPSWDKKLKAFFKLAELPWEPKDVGWWIVAKGGSD